MRLLIRFLAVSVCAVVVFLGVCLVRTFMYSPPDTKDFAGELPDAPAFDVDAAAQTLSQAIQLQTITLRGGDPATGKDQPWADLRALLEASFPELASQAEYETIAGNSLDITWPGTDLTAPPLILMGHMDVVPVDLRTLSDWAHPPFDGVIADGFVWGRGAMDCKGPVIAMLHAANTLAASGWKPERTIIFQFGHDEEVLGSGAQAGFQRLKSEGITPYMVLDEGMEVISRYSLTGEPAALIGIAEKGYQSVRITARSSGGHAAIPPRNSNAVRLAQAINALDNNQMPVDVSAPPFPQSARAMADHLPFKIKFAMANRFAFGWMMEGISQDDVMFNALIRTTTAPTMLNGSIKENVMPTEASVVFNFRIHPSNSAKELGDHIENVLEGIDGLDIEFLRDGIWSEPSPVASVDGTPYRNLASVASNVGGGVPVIPGMVVGATDARFAALVANDNIFRFVPAFYTPEDIGRYHGLNERLSLENLERMMTGYAHIMMMASDDRSDRASEKELSQSGEFSIQSNNG